MPPTHVEDAYRVLLRRSLTAGAAVALVCVVVAAVLAGLHGALSALLGSAMVLVFFGARLLVMRRTARSNPQLVLVAALGVYTVKIVVLGVAMVLLRGFPGSSAPPSASPSSRARSAGWPRRCGRS